MSESWKVGIELALLGNLESALGALGGKFLGLHGNAKELNKTLGATGNILKGFAAIGIGVGLVAGLKGIVDQGKELVRLQNNMKLAGADAATVADATAKSWAATANFTNVSVKNAMEFADKFRPIFGSQKDANSFIGLASGFDSFLQAFMGTEAGHGSAMGVMREVEAAVKSGEINNKITPALMEENLMRLASLKVAFGDTVSLTTYLAAQRQAGTSYRMMSDDMKFGVFPALVQEFGPGAGNQMMTAFQRIGAGTMWRGYALEEGLKDHLIDPHYVEFNKKGKPVRLTSGLGVVGNELAISDQFKYVTDILGPHLMVAAKKQLLVDQKTHPDMTLDKELISMMSRFLPDRKAALAMTTLLFGEEKFRKDIIVGKDGYRGLKDAGGFQGYNQNSLDYQEQSLPVQVNNLATALGSPMVKDAARVLGVLTKAISGLAQTTAAHPDLVRTVGGIAAGAAAVSTMFGIFKVGQGLLGMATLSPAVSANTAATIANTAALTGSGALRGLDKTGGGFLSGLLLSVLPSLMGSYLGGEAGKAVFPRTPEQQKQFDDYVNQSPWQVFGGKSSYSGPHARSRPETHGLAYYNEHGLPAPKQNIQVNPQITATQSIYIDGKKVADAVYPMIVKMINALIPHPTSAPMSNSTQFAPSFDSMPVF